MNRRDQEPNYRAWKLAEEKFKTFNTDWKFVKEHETQSNKVPIDDAIHFRNGRLRWAIEKYDREKTFLVGKLMNYGLTYGEMAYF